MDRTKHQFIWRKIATLILFLFVGITIKAQDVTTTGTVVDTNGEPLIGVSVMAQGTAKGTTTDIEGRYSITVRANATLIFSYVGMTTQSIKAVNGTLNVTLRSEATALDEMVVVGYGVQRKSDVTGAISKIEGTALENLALNNPTAALAGKTSGVQVVSTSGEPGSSPTIRVRG